MVEPGGEIILPKSETDFKAPKEKVEAPLPEEPEPKRWIRGETAKDQKTTHTFPGIVRDGMPASPTEVTTGRNFVIKNTESVPPTEKNPGRNFVIKNPEPVPPAEGSPGRNFIIRRKKK